MSEHEVKVVRIERIDKHDNADTLEVVPVWGYTSCSRIGDFHVGDLAAFIEPDTLVPVAEPEFAFLADQAKEGFVRIKAKRLRGVQSFGLLIKARPHWNEGDNVMGELGCTHYEPPLRGANTGGANAPAPKVQHVHYDVESMRKHDGVIKTGELVEITEKIHGANARYVWHDGALHCGSHTNWKAWDEGNLWWKAALAAGLEEKLARFPDHVFYGEVFGQVQDLRYGTKTGEPPRLYFFDIMRGGTWMSVPETHHVCASLGLLHAPVLYQGHWDPSCARFADGPSVVPGADHIREGCVVKPVLPRWDEKCGRVILKLVSVDYLSRKEKK